VVVDATTSPDTVKLRVTDNGPGIPAEELPHIFEKFVKGADSGSLRPYGAQGTGLGLAIAKGIMEAHDGAIEVESPLEKGRGARFILTFPREGSAG